MKQLLTILLLSCATVAQANTLTFTGIVTTALVEGNIDPSPVAAVGDKVHGFISFYRLSGDVIFDLRGDSALVLPGALVTPEAVEYFDDITGGYTFYSETFGPLGQDGEFSFTALLNGTGTFLASGINHDPDEPSGFSGRQIYTGDITSVKVVPDTGGTIWLTMMSLAGLAVLGRKR